MKKQNGKDKKKRGTLPNKSKIKIKMNRQKKKAMGDLSPLD